MADRENLSQEDVTGKAENRRGCEDRRKGDRRKFACLNGKDRRDRHDRRSNDRRIENQE